jgi:hypothetical protein
MPSCSEVEDPLVTFPLVMFLAGTLRYSKITRLALPVKLSRRLIFDRLTKLRYAQDLLYTSRDLDGQNGNSGYSWSDKWQSLIVYIIGQ